MSQPAPSLIDRVKRAVQGAMLGWSKRSNLVEPPPWLLSMLGAPTSAAGVDVIPETAITLAVVWCCVKILSETIGSLPLYIYERSTDSEGNVVKNKAFNHPLWDMLHFSPNEEMTAIVWRMTAMTHLALWGNHYSQIVRDKLGRPLSLWPIHPQRVRVMRDIKTKQLYYLVQPMFGNMQPMSIPKDDMLHIKGLSFTGLVGLSPLGAAREAVGLGLAAQEYGARFFSNDASIGKVLEHPAALGDEAYKRLKQSIEDQTRSLRDKHRMIILEEGMKLGQHSLGIPPEDAQFLQSRTFQIADIARFYRMPLYKLSENLNTKNANVEQVAIEFVTDTIMPWVVNFEQEFMFKLFTPEERAAFYCSFDLDELLRGDLDSRYKAYQVGRQFGWLSANDVRHKENMNPIPGGDAYMVPLNQIPADKIEAYYATGKGPAAPKEPPATNANAAPAKGEPTNE